jgi:putative serine protease PepD
MRALLVAALVAVLVAAAGCGGGPAPGADHVRSVVDDASPSVVSVQAQEGRHSGTGFRVGIDGIVVTSAQAVSEAADGAAISVVLVDGTRRAATVLGRSIEVDIAAIRLDGGQIPAMHSRSGFAQARAGDRVMAVRAPPRDAAPAIPATLLAKDRRVALSGGAEQAVIALDADVDPGASGAPVVNAAGDVLGVITSAVAAGTGQPGDRAFAIPVDVARQAVFAIVDTA